MPEREQQRLLRAALERETVAQRLLIGGDGRAASAAYREVAALYRRSWEAAHERAFGRLIGYLKAGVLAGGGTAEAAYVREQLGDRADSTASAYALALAALIAGEDRLAAAAAESMRGGSAAFNRAAEAIESLAAGEQARYAAAVGAIVADFAARDEHLTGIALADTALVLDRLATSRGMEPAAALDLDESANEN